MIMFCRLAGLLAGVLLGASVHAGDLRINGAWARSTAPGQDTAMVDLSITSKQPATLIGFSSAASKTVELHSMTHDNGVMRMREVKLLELPAGKQIHLGESGYHLMLIGLKTPLKVGAFVPMTLSIKLPDGAIARLVVKAEVKSPSAEKHDQQESEQMHQHHH